MRINGCLAFQRDWGSFCKDVDSGSTGLGFADFLKDLENFSEDLAISLLLV